MRHKLRTAHFQCKYSKLNNKYIIIIIKNNIFLNWYKVGILSLMVLIWSLETFCHHVEAIKYKQNNPNFYKRYTTFVIWELISQTRQTCCFELFFLFSLFFPTRNICLYDMILYFLSYSHLYKLYYICLSRFFNIIAKRCLSCADDVIEFIIISLWIWHFISFNGTNHILISG